MKALKLFGANDIRLVSEAIPEPADDEAVLRVKAASICGTDIRMWKNGAKAASEEHPLTLGHEFAAGVCTRCGGVCGVDIPHELVTEKGKAATCTEDGYTENVYCKNCYAIIKMSEVIPALGHDYQGGTHCVRCTADLNGHVHEWVIQKRVLPTCQEPGMTEGKYCKTCGYVELVRQFLPRIPHVYVNGKCKNCGKKEEE